MELNYFNTMLFLGAPIAFFSSLLVYLKNRNALVNKHWFYVNVFTSTWAFHYALMITTTSYRVAWYANLILHAAAIFVPTTFLHFTLALTNKINTHKKILILAYATSAIFFILNPTRLFVDNVIPKYIFNYAPNAGKLYFLFFIAFFGWGIYAAYILLKTILKKEAPNSYRLKFILFAELAGYIGGGSVFALTFNVPFPPYPIALFTFYPLVIMYAIVRHRLMDIRLVVKRFTVYTAALVSVTLLAFGIYFIGDFIFKGDIPFRWFGPSVLFIGVVVFEPLKKYLEHFANKYLFTSLYDTEKTIQQLTKSLASTIHLNEVTSTIVNVMSDTMKPEKIGVMLRRDAKTSSPSYMAAQLVNFDEKREIPLVESTFLNNYLQKIRQPLVYDEVNMITNLAQREKTQLAKTAKEMKENGVAIALPLIAKDQLVGIILLGNKISRDAYTKEDFKLLEIVSSQAAIAIENAILYNNMREVVNQQTRDIRAKTEKLQQLLKLRSEFLDIASHQLRTPVSVINGTISMIRDGDIEKLPPADQQKFFDNIFLKGKKLESIISDILAASEMDEEFTITPGDEVDIAKLLEQTIETYKFDAEEKKLQLTLQLPSPAPAPVPGNAKYLEQVIDNLLSNALHYTEKGSITVRLQKKDDKSIVFSVADTGIGVPKKDQPRLFDKFARGENARNMYTDGSGLGLFIIKKIVDAHPGGKVWMESEEGKGSTFYVQLSQSK